MANRRVAPQSLRPEATTHEHSCEQALVSAGGDAACNGPRFCKGGALFEPVNGHRAGQEAVVLAYRRWLAGTFNG